MKSKSALHTSTELHHNFHPLSFTSCIIIVDVEDAAQHIFIVCNLAYLFYSLKPCKIKSRTAVLLNPWSDLTSVYRANLLCCVSTSCSKTTIASGCEGLAEVRKYPLAADSKLSRRDMLSLNLPSQSWLAHLHHSVMNVCVGLQTGRRR